MKKNNLILPVSTLIVLLFINGIVAYAQLTLQQQQHQLIETVPLKEQTKHQFHSPHGGCDLPHAASRLFKEQPELRPLNNKAYQELEEFTQKFIAEKARGLEKSSSTPNRIIPVVFHIVHMCGPENITKAQIDQALDELNKDFNAQNSDLSVLSGTAFDTTVANINLEFKLAEIDPNGNATNGITRTKSFVSYNGTSHETKLKKMIQWDRSKYLNVWIVNSTGGSGYAQYPSTTDGNSAYLDGIVISHNYLGTTGAASNNNRPHILAHEVGHWLNLQHTWGDDDDGYPVALGKAINCSYDDDVEDTPNTIGNNFEVCPNAPISHCGSEDNFFNMMDYGCEVMFTEDQKDRMEATLESTIAQRNLIGTDSSNAFVFMNNPNQAALTTEEFVFQESINNDGTIENCITIKLSSGYFHPNFDANDYAVSSLPTGLGMVITKTSSTTLSACLNGTAVQSNVANNVDSISITFNSTAFYNNTQYNALFNSIISGFSIDFKDDFDLAYIPYYNMEENLAELDHSENGQFDDFHNNFIGRLALVYYNNPSKFIIYKLSSNPVEVLCNSNSYHITQLNENITVGANTGTYRLVGGGAETQTTNTILWSQAHTDWAGQTGYMGIRFKSDCTNDYNYGWIRFKVAANGSSVEVIDMMYDETPGNAVITGAAAPCEEVLLPANPTGHLYIDQVNIDAFSNSSTFGNTGQQDFTNQTINVNYGNTAVDFKQGNFGTNSIAHWYVFIDFDGDGYFRLGEKVLGYEGIDLRSGYTNGANTNYAPYLNIPSSVPQGVPMTMRIIVSMYPLNSICGTYQYGINHYAHGEIEDYTVVIGSGAACPSPSPTDLSTPGTWCTGAYLYCYNHSGQEKRMRYRLLNGIWSSWTYLSTTEYYKTFTGLTPSSNYEYEVQVKCMTTGIWSAATTATFNTPTCKSGADNIAVLDQQEETSIQVYPNPVEHFVHIEVMGNIPIKNVKIFNVQGKLVKEIQPQINKGGVSRLDLSDLMTGIYIIQINQGEQVTRITKM